MAYKNDPHELGVGLKDGEVLLFYAPKNRRGNFLQIASSEDGLRFNFSPKNAAIAGKKEKNENVCDFRDLRISKLANKYFLTYKLQLEKPVVLHGALSTDFLKWERLGKISGIGEIGMAVPDYQYQEKYVMYFGEKVIRIAFSKDLKNWEIPKQPVLEPRENHFDDSPIELGSVISLNQYILVIYYVKKNIGGSIFYSVGAAMFDKRAPEILLWRSDNPLWETPDKWRQEKISPLGAAYLNERLLLYWRFEGKGLFVVSCLTPGQALTLKDKIFALILKRFGKNPIIKPILKHPWESKATFNSAAIYEDGKVHFVYRAIGDKDISVLGYASSQDGLNIDERLSEPVYIPAEPFECSTQIPIHIPTSFVSGGGGCGGCEDPRLTKIDGKIYMTYVAFDGASPPRVALTSIKVDDFLNKRWNWEKPKLISPPGVVDKNACLLPEKINGKYVIFHRIFPNILIDLVDDLNFDSYLKGDFLIKPREDSWDSLKVGVGAPPIRTKDGWLLIYHAVGYHDRGRYKIGAMLLDLYNPTKVLFRSNAPILEPTESYENEGFKAGVAYPCGAVVFKNRLFVYYGGADMVVCAASKNLNTFLGQLKSSHLPQLEPIIYPLQISSLR